MAPAAPSPLSVVTSALARTSTQSYTFSLDTTVRSPQQELNSDLVSGAYDPGHHLSTELLTVRAAGMPPGDLYGFVSDQPVSPAELNMGLRSAGTVVHDSGPVSGPGWSGSRYTFAASLSGGQQSVRGSVDVDRQGRVRRMATTTERRQQAEGKPFVTTVRDFTFGDFGAPVQVTTPPASQVRYTSGTPYWGFYF